MTRSTQLAADDLSPDWAESAVQVEDTTVHYRSAGDGTVVVVVADRRCATSPALDRLAAQHRVVLADLVVEARSTARARGGRIAALAGALGLDAPAVLAAGADTAAALWAAVDHPDLVRTLVLEAPTIFADDTVTDPQLLEAMVTCEVSTLVLLGQLDPAAGPRFAGDYKRLPASSVAIVYAAGPDIRGQRPEAFVATVGDYLQRGQAFVLSTASTLIHA